jgi:hypothetical protein
MKCGACGATLTQESQGGEPLLRNRGMILKASGPVVICPKCKADVPLSPPWAKALQQSVVLFFKK